MNHPESQFYCLQEKLSSWKVSQAQGFQVTIKQECEMHHRQGPSKGILAPIDS